MNLLLYGDIRSDGEIPAFGGEFMQHIQSKRNPGVYAASLSAWRLLAYGLQRAGIDSLPDVSFNANGKPYFTDCSLHFSLSHSAGLAVTLISSAPCGADVEIIRSDVSEKFQLRCLSEDELRRGCDFFEIWTKKESAVKLEGGRLPSRPSEFDLGQYDALNWLSRRVCDSSGRAYALSAVCTDPSEIIVTTG